MHLNGHNIRPWARQRGATSHDLRCVVEMETVSCRSCGDHFTDPDDLNDDRLCDVCAEDSIDESDVRGWRTYP